MNITKKNMTFTLAEESGGYSFNGDFVLDAAGLAEFRGSVTPKAGGRMGSVYFNETGDGGVSVSFCGSREDFSEALAALGTLVKAAKETINGTGAEEDKPHTAGQPKAPKMFEKTGAEEGQAGDNGSEKDAGTVPGEQEPTGENTAGHEDAHAVPSGSGNEVGERQVGNDGSGEDDNTVAGKQEEQEV